MANVPIANLAEAVAEECRRLTPEYNEDYRVQAALIEQDARLEAIEELMALEAGSAVCVVPAHVPTSSDEVSLALMAAETQHAQREVMALEGELLQERVFEEELRSSQAAREEAWSCELSEELQQERAAAKRLQEHAWRAQNSERASEAHAAFLEAQADDLQRRSSRLQLLAGAEAGELAALEDQLQRLQAAATEEAEEEIVLARRQESSQGRILDLGSEAGARLFGEPDPEVEATAKKERLRRLLLAGLPGESASADLEEIVRRTEREHVNVMAFLGDPFLTALDPMLQQEQEEAHLAHKVQQLELQALTQSEQIGVVESESAAVAKHLWDYPKLEAEVDHFRRGNADLQARQDAYRKALPRPPGAGMAPCMSRPRALREENASLRDQIRKLEDSKLELIKSQQALIEFVKSNVPQLEDAVSRELQTQQAGRGEVRRPY